MDHHQPASSHRAKSESPPTGIIGGLAVSNADRGDHRVHRTATAPVFSDNGNNNRTTPVTAGPAVGSNVTRTTSGGPLPSTGTGIMFLLLIIIITVCTH